MNRKLADDKKMSKKEKDERILWKKNEVNVCRVNFLLSSKICFGSKYNETKCCYTLILMFVRLFILIPGRFQVGDYEATTFSIFWNNILFLSLLLILSFFLFASISSTFNCLFSMVGAAGLVALFSTAK